MEANKYDEDFTPMGTGQRRSKVRVFVFVVVGWFVHGIRTATENAGAGEDGKKGGEADR